MSATFTPGNRKAVRVSQQDLVRTSWLDDAVRFPLVVEPNLADVNLVSYATAAKEELEARLLQHGAILFRGFSLAAVEQFQEFVAAVSSGPLEYTERSSPRSRVSGKIFTSTDYPPNLSIFLHNEQSYNLVFPRKILFYCVTAASQGGETPIADCRKVFAQVPREIQDRFARLGYAYVRNFGAGFGLPWQEAFQTEDRDELAAYCAANRIELEWLDGGRLRTRQIRPALALHPLSGVPTWFNHLTFFHVSTLVPAVRDAMLNEFAEADLPNNTYYGDGSPIEPEVLSTLRDIYARQTVTFPWQQGDVLLLDNMLSAHGRAPFTGARKVVVGMADPVRWDDLRSGAAVSTAPVAREGAASL